MGVLVKCFGVGDGWPSAERQASAFLYRLGRTTLLLDCGEGVSGSYQACGLSFDRIDRVILSHLHADHVGGFFMLLQGLWLKRRRRPLLVHLPAHGIRPLQQMLRACNLFDELLDFRLRLKPLRAGVTIRVGTVRVTPFPTSHLEGMRRAFGQAYPGHFQSYCFLLETGRLRFGHSADIGRPEDLAPLLARPLDLLICELSHVRPRRLFSYLQGQPIKQVVFVHLARRYWADLAATRRLAARMLPHRRLIFARDGQEIAFDNG